MDTIIKALSTQVPDLVVLLIIVFAFLKYLQKRDDTYMQLVREINLAQQETTRMIQQLTKAIEIHSQETSDGIAEMHRVVLARKRSQKK